MASDVVNVDVLIFGGGVAGLWTLARLRREGYSCVLVERDALGAGQTIASQGIIHGGIKFALTGKASRASAAIAEMPGIWDACLAGSGEVDLGAARVLSERQYLWTTAGIGSRLMGVAAGHVIRTSVERIAPEVRPECFRGAGRGVDVYTVAEKVLEPRSVVGALAASAGGEGAAIVRCAAMGVEHDAIRLRGVLGDVRVRARRVVVCAGEGNAVLMDELCGAREADPPRSVGVPKQQVRPLHMVMVRGSGLPEVFGHCVGVSDRPRVTITSQMDSEDRVVWYVGGEIAESGVDRDVAGQIAAARAEIGACVPWVDLAGTQWATLRINRAEGMLGEGRKGERPDEPVVVNAGGEFGVIAAYPTKLAFAPLLAERVLGMVKSEDTPTAQPPDRGRWHEVVEAFKGFERPLIAPLPWERGGVEWK